jgi:hypothetical protein
MSELGNLSESQYSTVWEVGEAYYVCTPTHEFVSRLMGIRDDGLIFHTVPALSRKFGGGYRNLITGIIDDTEDIVIVGHGCVSYARKFKPEDLK